MAAMVWRGGFWVRGQAAGRPGVNDLWRQLFGNGQATYAVLADVNLLIFENLIGRSVPVSEYETHEFDRLAELYVPEPAQRALAHEVVNRVTTSVSDVLARGISECWRRRSTCP